MTLSKVSEKPSKNLDLTMGLAIWRQTGGDHDKLQQSEGDATLTGMVQKTGNEEAEAVGLSSSLKEFSYTKITEK